MTHTNRPHIICHMMMTIDGKITGGDGADILSDDYFDLYTQTEDQLPAHTGWMCGRVTMEMFASKERSELPPTSTDVPLTDYVAPHKQTKFMFGVDTKGLLRWDKNTIQLSNIPDPLHLVVVVTQSTPKAYLHYLQDKKISYVIAGTNTIDFPLLFGKAKDLFHVETLLLEGGAILNGSVMASDLVDEISVLVTPTVINRSQAPSLFEDKTEKPLNLRHCALQSVRQLDKDTVWLRYSKRP